MILYYSFDETFRDNFRSFYRAFLLGRTEMACDKVYTSCSFERKSMMELINLVNDVHIQKDSEDYEKYKHHFVKTIQNFKI